MKTSNLLLGKSSLCSCLMLLVLLNVSFGQFPTFQKNQSPEAKMIGKWISKPGPKLEAGAIELQLGSKSRMTMKVKQSGFSSASTGTWSVKGEQILFHFPKVDQEFKFKLSNQTLSLSSSNGNQFVLVKVQATDSNEGDVDREQTDRKAIETDITVSKETDMAVDKSKKKGLVGKWYWYRQTEEGTVRVNAEFFPSGEFRYAIVNETRSGRNSEVENGKWKTSDGKLILTYPGETESAPYEIKNGVLILEMEGVKMEFVDDENTAKEKSGLVVSKPKKKMDADNFQRGDFQRGDFQRENVRRKKDRVAGLNEDHPLAGTWETVDAPRGKISFHLNRDGSFEMVVVVTGQESQPYRLQGKWTGNQRTVEFSSEEGKELVPFTLSGDNLELDLTKSLGAKVSFKRKSI